MLIYVHIYILQGETECIYYMVKLKKAAKKWTYIASGHSVLSTANLPWSTKQVNILLTIKMLSLC